MPWPSRVSHRPLNAEAQVRSQDAALNSVADSGPLGVAGALCHRSVLVTVQTHTSPKRYQSFGHTQRYRSYTPVRFVTGLAPVLLGHSKAADAAAGRCGGVGENQKLSLHG